MHSFEDLNHHHKIVEGLYFNHSMNCCVCLNKPIDRIELSFTDYKTVVIAIIRKWHKQDTIIL